MCIRDSLYTGGSLPIETFITTIVLSLGIAGPLLAAMDFVDSLAKVGTIVGSVDAILNGAEQDHGEAPVEFRGRDIQLSHVSFGYHADKEVLHDVAEGDVYKRQTYLRMAIFLLQMP